MGETFFGDGRHLAYGSVVGLGISLERRFRPRWRHRLPCRTRIPQAQSPSRWRGSRWLGSRWKILQAWMSASWRGSTPTVRMPRCAAASRGGSDRWLWAFQAGLKHPVDCTTDTATIWQVPRRLGISPKELSGIAFPVPGEERLGCTDDVFPSPGQGRRCPSRSEGSRLRRDRRMRDFPSWHFGDASRDRLAALAAETGS